MAARIEPADHAAVDAFEAMATARTIRHFRPEAIPDELLARVLWAATRASSPINSQCWDFVVVRSEEQKRLLQQGLLGFADRVTRTLDITADEVATKVAGVQHMVDTFHEIPAIIVIVGGLVYPPVAPRASYTRSAICGAAQNLLVAATAVGLGAAFTTLHELDPDGFRRTLGIPEDRLLGVTMPIGWPERGVGPVRRRPLHEVVHGDRWGDPAPFGVPHVGTGASTTGAAHLP